MSICSVKRDWAVGGSSSFQFQTVSSECPTEHNFLPSIFVCHCCHINRGLRWKGQRNWEMWRRSGWLPLTLSLILDKYRFNKCFWGGKLCQKENSHRLPAPSVAVYWSRSLLSFSSFSLCHVSPSSSTHLWIFHRSHGRFFSWIKCWMAPRLFSWRTVAHFKALWWSINYIQNPLGQSFLTRHTHCHLILPPIKAERSGAIWLLLRSLGGMWLSAFNSVSLCFCTRCVWRCATPFFSKQSHCRDPSIPHRCFLRQTALSAAAFSIADMCRWCINLPSSHD